MKRLACRLGLALLPIALALAGYYRPLLRGGPLPRLAGDGAFYVYQLARSCELGGRWWKLGVDDLAGQPYPTVAAKHPGLYEGVDLMLAAAVTGRFLGPTANYHAMTVLALIINGWVAAWLAYRLTRSHGWAALAVVLITLNFPTAGRVSGHLHLFKFGWALLAVGAFARYLEAPTRRRGLALGLAAAWALQGSFYLGAFLGMGLAAWWLGCLAAGKIGRAHGAATLGAGLAFALAGAALTFPVWIHSRNAQMSGDYFRRWRLETWLFGAELWQYFTPPDSGTAAEYIAGFRQKSPGAFWEGWYYPGHVVLMAVAVYAIARLRGRRLGAGDPRFLDLAMGLIGVFVLLSLAGGPSFVIYQWFPGFRCYGRAGLLALALGSATAPAVLQGMIASLRNRGLRWVAVAGIVVLAGYDSARAVSRFQFVDPGPDPAWSDWLATQPAGVRLAAFPASDGEPFIWWGVDGLEQRLKHRHATLNGGEFALLEGDLRLVGASYEGMTSDGLRLIVSLGYDVLAFHRDYLTMHPWIASLPWLDRLEEVGGWTICRANPRARRFPTTTLERLLAGQQAPEVAKPIPADAWITGLLPMDEEVVVTGPARVRMVWKDARGVGIGRPSPALFQHIFGPGRPAYTVRSPKRAGRYRLEFLDDGGRSLASVRFVVDPNLKTGRRAGGEVAVTRIEGGSDRVVIENPGPNYLQAHANRDLSWGAGCAQPGMYAPAPGSLVLRVRTTPGAGGSPREVDLLMPADLPPGGRLELRLPLGLVGDEGGRSQFEVAAHVLRTGGGEASATAAGSDKVRR